MSLKGCRKRPVYAVVSHDAGGAEIVSSWVRHHPENDYRFILGGPAVRIFKGKCPAYRNEPPSLLNKCIAGSDMLLTGTSWASDMEKRAILIAKENNVHSASFIDHWVCYPERFKFAGKMILPDEIWVGDRDAFVLAKKHFPESLLRLISNPYFEDVQKEIRAKVTKRPDRSGALRIAYICEPIAEQAKKEYGKDLHFGYTEFDAMDNFLRHVPYIAGNGRAYEIRIRLHPAESKGKYAKILRRYPDVHASISEGTSLVDDCVWADLVAGCESTALVVGLLASRKVLSVIPESGKNCSLPQKKIMHLHTKKR